MNIENPKAKELVQSLYTLTERAKLNWQESVDEDSFFVAFPTYSVILSKKSTDYVLDIVNGYGRIVETILIRFSSKEPSLFQETEELHKLVRQQGLKTDEIMTDLLESLHKML